MGRLMETNPRFIVRTPSPGRRSTVWDTKLDIFVVHVDDPNQALARTEADRLANLLNADLRKGLEAILAIHTTWGTQEPQ